MDEPEIVNHIIIPPHEAEKLVTQASQVYLQQCPCRVEKQACPPEKWEVCLLFETVPEKDRQQARLITAEEAVRIIRLTAGRGDIQQLFYLQNGARPHELCNCCTCCCFPLREAKEKGNFAEQLRSGYVAVTDELLCTACGSCVDSCFFEARQLQSDTLHLIDERCFGCGRCIADCPAEAIRLEFQTRRGVVIPSAC